jgi:ferric-dicitrate binding protein FerR (iron transport regulator)
MLSPTQIAVGVRGTVYWISHRDGVETVAVEKGSVWLQRFHGKKLVGKRWIVKAGETAEVRRHHDPVVKNTKSSAPNPWSSWTSG